MDPGVLAWSGGRGRVLACMYDIVCVERPRWDTFAAWIPCVPRSAFSTGNAMPLKTFGYIIGYDAWVVVR